MLTLEEIENISFHKSGIGGYKIDEVESFVDKVIKKVKSLENENREFENRIELLNKQIMEYKEKEDTVQSAIITAQMTAKQIVMEATEKSDKKLSESKEEAEKLLSDSREKSEKMLQDSKERTERLNAETDKKLEEKVNKALRDSAEKIEENNRILEAQKRNIIQLMGEANNFRNSLLRAYKEHLSVINSMAKGEDFKKYQKELEQNYRTVQGNKPAPSADNDIPSSEKTNTEEKSEKAVCPDTDTKTAAAPEKHGEAEIKSKRQPVVVASAGDK